MKKYVNLSIFICLIFLAGYYIMEDKQKPNSTYVLGTGGRGAHNLDLQNEILKQESFAQLKEAGLTKGMVVWDIGCGSGAMTEYLAEMVGNEGIVYAMDVSEDQIKVVKNRIEASGHKNVKFIVGDIDTIDNSEYKKADIVYSRLLLMHVRDPKKVIKNMASLLKPGGIVSLQESSFNSVSESCNDPSLNKYFELLVEYGKLKGFDYDIGRKLPIICNELNIFSEVKYYTTNYKTTDYMRKLFSLRLDELQDKLIGSKLITDKEYVSLKKNILEFLKDKKSDDCMIMSEQSYILARTKQ